jgi:uncharacterized protein with von Willebrand factor type A (vWA) domain
VKTRLLRFVNLLREVGLPITVAETLDALRAVPIVGVERTALRDGLAATLLKDETDRAAFEAAFDRCFPVSRRPTAKRPRVEANGEAGTGDTGKSGVRLRPAAPPNLQQADQPRRLSAPRLHGLARHRVESARDRPLPQKRRLQTTPFDRLLPQDIQPCDLLVAELRGASVHI